MKNVEGLSVEVSANTTEYQKNMSKLRRELSVTSTEIKKLKKDLQFDPGSIEKINAVFDKTKDKIDLTKRKAKELTAELKRMEAAGETDNAKYDNLRRQLINAESAAAGLEKELQDLNQQKIDIKVEEASNETAKFARQLNIAEAELGKLQSDLKLDSSSMSQINDTLAKTKNTLQLTQQKASALKNELNVLENAGRVDTDEYSRLKVELIKTTSSAENLERELQELNQHKINLNTARAQAEMTSLTQKAQQAAQKISASFDKAGNALNSFGSGISNAGSSMLGVTAAVAGAGVAVTKFGADMQDTEQATNAVFGGAITKQIEQFGNTAASSLGLSKQAAMQATTSYGNMWTSMGAGKQKSADLSMQMVQLAADASSFTGVPVEEAVNAMTGALSGETEALKSLGVVMTDTQVQQYAQQQGFKGSWQEADNLTKSQYRLKFIQEQLKNSNGDFDRSSDSLQNTLKTLKANVENLASSMGTALIPVLQPIAEKLNEMVEKFNQMTPAQQRMIAGMALLAAAIGPVLVVIGKMSMGLGAIMKVGSFLATTVFPMLTTTITAVGAPVWVVGGAIAALGTAFAIVYTKCEAFRNGINSLVSVIVGIAQDAFKMIGNLLKTFLKPIIDTIRKAWAEDLEPAMAKVGNYINNTLVPTIKTLWEWFKKHIYPIIQEVARVMGGVFSVVIDNTASVIGGLIGFVMDLFSWLGKLWKKFSETSFAKSVMKAFEGILQWVKDLIKGVGDFIGSFGDMKDKVIGWAQDLARMIGQKFKEIGDWFSSVNPFDAGGFGGVQQHYSFAAGGYGIAAGGSGDINVTFNLTNNGQNISESTFKSYGKTIVDIVDEELYKRGRI